MQEYVKGLEKFCRATNSKAKDNPVLLPTAEQLSKVDFSKDLTIVAADYQGEVSKVLNLLLNSGFKTWAETFGFKITPEEVRALFLQKVWFRVDEEEKNRSDFGLLLPKNDKFYKEQVKPLKDHPDAVFANILKTVEKEMGGIPFCQLNKQITINVHVVEYVIKDQVLNSLEFEISGQVGNESEDWVRAKDTLDLPKNFEEMTDEVLLKELNLCIQNVMSFWLLKYYSKMRK